MNETIFNLTYSFPEQTVLSVEEIIHNHCNTFVDKFPFLIFILFIVHILKTIIESRKEQIHSKLKCYDSYLSYWFEKLLFILEFIEHIAIAFLFIFMLVSKYGFLT